MYSTKEKIHIFRKLSCPDVVEADLALLHEKAPHLTDFIRFDFAPRKNHEDILFCLLDFCEQDEIIRYRREFFAAADGEGNDSPADGDDTDNPTDGEANESAAENNKTPAVDNSSEKGSNQSKEPVTPKKKKKNTRK
jgi:hypothetical protein